MPGELNYFNYFTEIEDLFVRLRAKHVFISPLDWVLIEQWKTKGIPLYVVLRGIETAFTSHAASRNRRAVKTLVYCQEEVEAQYGEWLESQVGATAVSANGSNTAVAEPAKTASSPFPREVIEAHVGNGLNALRSFAAGPTAQSPELREALERVITRLEVIVADLGRAAVPNAEALEDNLTELERLLHEALMSGLPADQIEESRRAADASLKEYKGRMTPESYEQARNGLVLKQLLSRHNLPRLSLFYI